MRNINILYLTPEKLFKDRYLLLKQWESLETLIPCFLRSLYEGEIQVKLHEFDRIFTGLKNNDFLDEHDVLARVASIWYYFTRLTHQSVGPRIGGFAEEMIKFWMERSNCYSSVFNDVTLGRVLREIFDLRRNYRNKIDFVAHTKREDNTSKVLFIELRMSEHTGGRTGQESLLDKFNKILDLVVSEELVKASLEKGINVIELIIAILFNESQELIERSRGNFERGRIKSLINYILEENHIWGRISKIRGKYVFCDGREIDNAKFKTSLEESNEFCIAKKDSDFKIRLKILLGNEFFQEVIGHKLEDLIKQYGNTIADDLWVMYTLAINELKIAKELRKTNVSRIYEIARTDNELKKIFEEFKKLYNEGENEKLLFEEYIEELNKIIDRFSNAILKVISEHNEELRLLETNDITKAYRYLRYICTAVLSLYLTLEVMNDKNFSKCRWEDLKVRTNHEISLNKWLDT